MRCIYEVAVLLICSELDSALCLLGIAITVALTLVGPGGLLRRFLAFRATRHQGAVDPGSKR